MYYFNWRRWRVFLFLLGSILLAACADGPEVCEDFEFSGILMTNENLDILGGDYGDWCYESAGGLVGPNRVFPAYPNPALPMIKIQWELADSSRVAVEIYNMDCDLVRNLYDGTRGPGIGNLIFDFTDNSGHLLPPAIYGCSVRLGDYECRGDIQLLPPGETAALVLPSFE